MKLSAIMTRPPITARDDTPVEEVAARMIARRVGCLPIVSGAGQLVGIVTPHDFGAKEGSDVPGFQHQRVTRNHLGGRDDGRASVAEDAGAGSAQGS
jgi:CBS-domain-containing membrane protein